MSVLQRHPDSQDPGFSTHGAAVTLLCLLQVVIVRRESELHVSGPPLAAPLTHLLVSSTQGWPPCRLLQETLQAPPPVPLLSDRRTLLAATLCDMLVVYLLPSSAGFLSKLCSKPVFLNLPMYAN